MSATRKILSDKTVRFSLAVCLLGFGSFVLWSFFAPLADGVVAYGKIVSENDRKTVQHLEGGIIDEILIREGDKVEAGAPLLVLTDIAASSGRDQIAEDLLIAQASISRLEALVAWKTEWEADEDWLGAGLTGADLDALTRADILVRQQALFVQQRRSYEADISVLQSRHSTFVSAAAALKDQIRSLESELAIVQDDLARRRQLLREKLTHADQVTQLERDAARLTADISRLKAEQQSAVAQSREIDTQMAQAQAHFLENANTTLVEERAKASEAQDKLAAARDVVNRKTIHAPQAGEILNLKFTTEGGVVRAGEAILEIVPETKNIIAVLELRPSDRDAVHHGLIVNTRLSGLNNWRAPVLSGRVVNVSADLKTSPRGDYHYYEARVHLDPDIAQKSETEIIPGMPVEAFVVSGHSRTLFQYLWEPISGTLRRGIQG